MTHSGVIMALSLLLAGPSSVFRAPVSNEGVLEGATVQQVQDRVDARVAESTFELSTPDDPAACDSASCWRAQAVEMGARYVLDVRIDSTQADQRIAVTVTDVADGTEVVNLSETCELCGRTELEDLAADATATALRKLQSYAAVSSTLVIDSVPHGATVMLDGVELGTTPLDVEVTAGEHLVELSAEGHAPFEQSVDVERGTRERLRLVMIEEAPVAAPPPQLDTGPTRRRGRVILSSVLLGSGVAGIGAGVALLVLHGRPITADCSGANIDADGDCHFLHDTQLGGAVALGLGAAAAVTGGVLLGLELRRGRGSSVSVAPAPTGAVVHGRF